MQIEHDLGDVKQEIKDYVRDFATDEQKITDSVFDFANVALFYGKM